MQGLTSSPSSRPRCCSCATRWSCWSPWPCASILLVFGLPGFAATRARAGRLALIDTVLPSIARPWRGVLLAISGPARLPGHLRGKGILRRLSTTLASGDAADRPGVVNLAMLVAAMVLVLGIGAAWLDMAMPASVGWFVVAFGLGAAALFAVGLLVARSRRPQAANAIGLLVFFPSLFLA